MSQENKQVPHSSSSDGEYFRDDIQSLRMSSSLFGMRNNQGVNNNTNNAAAAATTAAATDNDFDDFDDFAALVDSARILGSLGDSQHSYMERGSLFADSKFSAISAMSADFDRMFLEDSNRTMDSYMPLVASMLGRDNDGDDGNNNSNNMHVESIRSREGNEVLGRRHRRRVDQTSSSMNRIQIGDVNFDPAVNSQKFQRRSSCGDQVGLEPSSSAIMCPSDFSQPNLLAGFNPHQQRQDQASNGHHMNNNNNNNKGGAHQKVSYEEALQNLADSMKCTERSRQQLMVHRAIIESASTTQQHTLQQQQRVTPNPISIESLSKIARNNNDGTAIASSANQMQQQQHVASADTPDHLPVECLGEFAPPRTPPNDRSSVLEAFFSGNRGTLTNGLEHSRRQLKMHADRMSGGGGG